MHKLLKSVNRLNHHIRLSRQINILEGHGEDEVKVSEDNGAEVEDVELIIT